MMQQETGSTIVDDIARGEAESLRYPYKYSRIEKFAYPEGVQLAVNFTINFDAQLTRMKLPAASRGASLAQLEFKLRRPLR